MRDILFARGSLILVRKRRGFLVINTKKRFEEGHTHVRNEYIGRVIVDNVHKRVIPKSRNIETVISHIRVTKDKKYLSQLEDYLAELKGEN